jgi:hypothetical protein
MDHMPHAHPEAGHDAAAARGMAPFAVKPQQHGLGYGWPTVANPCVSSATSAISMAFTTGNKRQPRRLGQRST